MNSSTFSTDEILEIKRQLPRGAIQRIANKLGRNYSGVHKVLSGKAYSETVIRQALEEIESKAELRQRFETLKNKSA